MLSLHFGILDGHKRARTQKIQFEFLLGHTIDTYFAVVAAAAS